MQWNDVNFSAGIWLIPAKDTKTSTDYELLLIKNAIEVLQKRLEDRAEISTFVFPSKRGLYGYITVGDPHWKTAIIKVDLYHENPKFRLRQHELRRTLATWQLEAGVDISISSKTLGHSDLKSTKIYARTPTDLLRNSVEKGVDLLYYLEQSTSFDLSKQDDK